MPLMADLCVADQSYNYSYTIKPLGKVYRTKAYKSMNMIIQVANTPRPSVPK